MGFVVSCPGGNVATTRSPDEANKFAKETTCKKESECTDKKPCSKFSTVGPSREDSTIWLATVTCNCPEDIPKGRTVKRTQASLTQKGRIGREARER